MHTRRLLAAATLLTAFTAAPPRTVFAQRAPTGIGMAASSLLSSERLGAGTQSGWGLSGQVGVSSRASLEAAIVFFPSTLTEYPAGAVGAQRRYHAIMPSVTFRAPVAGDKTDFALLFGAGLMRYTLDSLGGSPAEHKTVPMLGVGAAFRVHLGGPFALEVSGRDWMSFSRQHELLANPQERGVGHSPELRMALHVLFRKKEPTLASFEDLPISYAQDFRPVDASTVTREPTHTTGARDHMHTDDGTSIGIKAVDMAEFNGLTSPTGVSVVAATGPVEEYDTAKLGTIYFASGSSEVAPSYRTLLADVATYLRQNPTVRLELTAYTDSSGAPGPNMSLAERRATAVKELLVRLYDISGARIKTTAYGVDYTAKQPAIARRTDLIAKTPRR